MSRANWFFAFPLDGAFVSDLPPLPTAFRRFHPDDVHLTLAFLGRCDGAAAERGLVALDDRLRSSPPPVLHVSLGDVVPMGPQRRYSALSALLARGRDEATACLASLGNVLLRAAVSREETRPALPHVTIARPTARATEAAREAGLAWAARLDLRSVHATLDRIALYTWSDDRRERQFQIVAERRLE